MQYPGHVQVLCCDCQRCPFGFCWWSMYGWLLTKSCIGNTCYVCQLLLLPDVVGFKWWHNQPPKMGSSGHSKNFWTLVYPFDNHSCLSSEFLTLIYSHPCLFYQHSSHHHLLLLYLLLYVSFQYLIPKFSSSKSISSHQLFLASLSVLYHNSVLFVTTKSWAHWVYEFIGL